MTQKGMTKVANAIAIPNRSDHRCVWGAGALARLLLPGSIKKRRQKREKALHKGIQASYQVQQGGKPNHGFA